MSVCSYCSTHFRLALYLLFKRDAVLYNICTATEVNPKNVTSLYAILAFYVIKESFKTRMRMICMTSYISLVNHFASVHEKIR